MSRNEEYECAISGVTVDGAMALEKDGLGTLPPGWTKLTVERREVNMKWMAIRDLKEAMASSLIKSLPEEQRDMQTLAITLQLDAQFSGLEAATPVYETYKEIVYLAPRDASPGIKRVIDSLRNDLGLEDLAYEDAPGEDDADEAEGEAPPAAPATPDKRPKG
jgi:hypothetical protein